jgi:GTP-binding protein LepA
VGYLIAGIKDVGEARSGETVTDSANPAAEPLDGYRRPQADGVLRICTRSTATPSRTCARAWRSCGSTTARSPTSPRPPGALGFGFRCGFLGLLHMEIVRERLEREFDLSLIATAPSVEYRGGDDRRRDAEVDNPSEPAATDRDRQISEPQLRDILTPSDYVGTIMELCQPSRRAWLKHGVPVARAGGASPTACRWPRW